MIDVVFSDTAHGNLAAATSSNPQTIEYMNHEVEEYRLNEFQNKFIDENHWYFGGRVNEMAEQ